MHRNRAALDFLVPHTGSGAEMHLQTATHEIESAASCHDLSRMADSSRLLKGLQYREVCSVAAFGLGGKEASSSCCLHA